MGNFNCARESWPTFAQYFILAIQTSSHSHAGNRPYKYKYTRVRRACERAREHSVAAHITPPHTVRPQANRFCPRTLPTAHKRTMKHTSGTRQQNKKATAQSPLTCGRGRQLNALEDGSELICAQRGTPAQQTNMRGLGWCACCAMA